MLKSHHEAQRCKSKDRSFSLEGACLQTQTEFLVVSVLQALISKAHNLAATLCPRQGHGINASPCTSPQTTAIEYLHLVCDRECGFLPQRPSGTQSANAVLALRHRWRGRGRGRVEGMDTKNQQ